ncbi:MAG: RDD family protein [Bacteroidales bacterium]|nr:RDD family protein [Bacteroidales bacterium]
MENRIGFGPRLGAYLLDIVLIAVINFILVSVLGVGALKDAAAGLEGTDYSAAATSMMGKLMASLAVTYAVVAVWFLLEAFTGYTVGKLILGIQAGNDNGTKADVGKLILRYVLKNIASLLGLLAVLTGISFLSTLGGILGLVIFIGCFIVLGEKKQAIHDMLAKTAVYKKSALK